MIVETPVQLLRIILYKIVRLEENYSEFISLLKFGDTPTGDNLELLSAKLRLKRLYAASEILYSSSLPHWLAAQNKRNTTEIAVEIVNLLCAYITGFSNDRMYPELPTQLLHHLKVEASSSGMILFRFEDGAIAYWLDYLLHSSLLLRFGGNSHPFLTPPVQLFAIQHSHARCCSLLRLAHQEQLIQLNQPHAQPTQWAFIEPDTIRWLNAKSQLQTRYAAEWNVINWLLLALDQIVEQPALSLKRVIFLAEEGSKAFQTLHRTLPLFGDFRTQPRDRIHAHLALILMTQRMLQFLLQQLNAPAPDYL